MWINGRTIDRKNSWKPEPPYVVLKTARMRQCKNSLPFENNFPQHITHTCRLRFKYYGTCAETRFEMWWHMRRNQIWNVMAHAQKPEFVFRRNGRVHLNRRGRQFSRLLAAEVCASAVVMLDTPCSEVVWRVMATHSILQFPLHFPSRASPCAITFQLDSTDNEPHN